MPHTAGCCTSVELHDFCAGRLSAAERARVQAHLRECRACADMLGDIQRTMRTSAESGADVPSKIDAEAQAGPSLAFLLPPDGPDEVGWLGHYRILRVLGQGGMGLVLEAEDTRLQRRVALKVMLPALCTDPAFRQRFLREARAMAAVTHDHIVTVFQVDMARGRDGQEVPYLAMQLLSGESLESRILRKGRLHPCEAVRIGRQIAEGLAAAHANGLIHRDIKPANIWLEGPRDRVKILDFGLARFAEGKSNLSVTGQFIGTPYYMSPEQGRGEAIDHRSDLFSLGCVLYVMLGGRLPFEGSNTMAVLTALAVKQPEPLAKLAPEAPAPLVELVHRLLAKEPADRPASAQVVAEMLEVLERGATLVLPGQAHGETAAVPTPPPTGLTPLPCSGSAIPSASVGAPSAAPAAPPARANWPLLVGLAAAGLVAIASVAFLATRRGDGHPADAAVPSPSGEPIVVGVLHSQSGTMRESEVPVLEMTRLALEQLNEQGGLLGRPVKVVLRDGASEEAVFAREAERLIKDDKVCTLFGCWTSASRKAVKEVVEAYNHLLIYPVQYEGMEQSPNIVYTGATPDQQLFPAIDWCVKKGFKKYFLVGSDYVYPRAVNALLRDKIAAEGGEVVGEEYLTLGTTVVDPVVAKITAARPDVVINTINGDTNVPFFREFFEKGLTARRTPIISSSLDESMLRNLRPRHVAGHYAAWSYFQTIPGKANQELLRRFRETYGEHRVVTDPMEAAWIGVQFWAQAVREAGGCDVAGIRRAIRGQMIDAPEGPGVKVDPPTQHTWKYFRLARVTDESRFEIVEAFDAPDCPEPFPPPRPRKYWEDFLGQLYKGWGNRWSSPGE